MKPATFQYHNPSTLAETTDLLSELGHDAELMAGNQSLGIVMANRLATPDHIIDIDAVDDLDYISVSDDTIEIGAMTTHRTIERSDDLEASLPLFPEAAEQIAGPTVRNLGTLGGSVGEADPAGNYPTVLTAIDSDIHLASSDGERTVPAAEYFIAYMFTDIGPEELITGISIDRTPFPSERTGMTFLEQKPASQTWPTISAATTVRVDDPSRDTPLIEDARVALANAADTPLRVDAAEEAVEGTSLSESSLADAAAVAIDTVDPAGELHADEEYKRKMAGEYTRRSLERSYERATGGDVTEGTHE